MGEAPQFVTLRWLVRKSTSSKYQLCGKEQRFLPLSGFVTDETLPITPGQSGSALVYILLRTSWQAPAQPKRTRIPDRAAGDALGEREWSASVVAVKGKFTDESNRRLPSSFKAMQEVTEGR